MVNEIYSINLEIDEAEKNLTRLKKRKEEIIEENKLWNNRGKESMPLNKVRNEHAM